MCFICLNLYFLLQESYRKFGFSVLDTTASKSVYDFDHKMRKIACLLLLTLLQKSLGKHAILDKTELLFGFMVSFNYLFLNSRVPFILMLLVRKELCLSHFHAAPISMKFDFEDTDS